MTGPRRLHIPHSPTCSSPMASYRFLAVALCASTSSVSHASAGTRSHENEIHTFATAAAIGAVVIARCPDLQVRSEGLGQLRDVLHVTPADDMAVELETRVYARQYAEQVGRDPTQWCADVYTRFGPGGTLMRGFLSEKE